MTNEARVEVLKKKIQLYTRGKVSINDLRFLLLGLANTYEYDSFESGVFTGLDALFAQFEAIEKRLDKEPQEVHNVTA